MSVIAVGRVVVAGGGVAIGADVVVVVVVAAAVTHGLPSMSMLVLDILQRVCPLVRSHGAVWWAWQR